MKPLDFKVAEPKQYVVVFARDIESVLGKVLLVLKDRPDYLKGRLNLIGGKIEPGEDPVEAACRELKEETGLERLTEYDPMVATDDAEVVGMILGLDCDIYVVVVDVVGRQELKPREGETEPVAWYYWAEAKADPRLMPNLKVAIPLIKAGLKGWTIEDRNRSFGEKHTVNVTV
jgi:8-oxo-dGTP pyrophosphatase MutT (NUDIX family)